MVTHIARWDLDKTYLRTEFDTIRDLVRTALERPQEKRTNPGAATLVRELVRAGVSVHILSGSPEQMRRRLEDKLRLDGIEWDAFTLKPNLQNVLRLRFRAVKDQLGYKLPALLRARAELLADGEPQPKETLFGDDAEVDAFIYAIYADIVAGRLGEDTLIELGRRGKLYDDDIATILRHARAVERGDCVERVLIHLERQTAPDEFRAYGPRFVPFYNYLQAACVVFEDGRIGPDAVLRVGAELVVDHHFDGDALARSYLDLVRRHHLCGARVDELTAAFGERWRGATLPAVEELERFVVALPAHAERARRAGKVPGPDAPIDYLAVLAKRERARKRRRR